MSLAASSTESAAEAVTGGATGAEVVVVASEVATSGPSGCAIFSRTG